MIRLSALAFAILAISSPAWAELPHCHWTGGFWACEHGWSHDGERERHEMWRERHREREEMRDREHFEWCRWHRC